MSSTEFHRMGFHRFSAREFFEECSSDDEYKLSIHKAIRITKLFSRPMYKRQGSRLGTGRDK